MSLTLLTLAVNICQDFMKGSNITGGLGTVLKSVLGKWRPLQENIKSNSISALLTSEQRDFL